MKGSAHQRPGKKSEYVENHVWGRVKAGFMLFVPILVTYLVLRLMVSYTDDLLAPLLKQLAPLLDLLPFNPPGLSLLLLFIIFYFTGLVVSPRVGKMTMAAQHAVFSRIPVVKSIYGLTEQVTGYLSSYDEFSRVVLVEWPKPNVFALGFVTGQCELLGDKDERIAIYIPTVPNPTSGMFALMSKAEVYDTDISVEEALKLVLSGGIALPEKLRDVDVKARWKDADDADDADDDNIQEQFSLMLDDHRNRRRGYRGYRYRDRDELYRIPEKSVGERW